MTNLEKATKLLENKEFVEKIAACKDQAAVMDLFKANGAELTDKEFATIGGIIKSAADDDGEIPDELAEQVAGGGLDNFGDILKTIGGVIAALGPLVDQIMSLFTGKKSDSESTSGETTKPTEEQKPAESQA